MSMRIHAHLIYRPLEWHKDPGMQHLLSFFHIKVIVRFGSLGNQLYSYGNQTQIIVIFTTVKYVQTTTGYYDNKR